MGGSESEETAALPFDFEVATAAKQFDAVADHRVLDDLGGVTIFTRKNPVFRFDEKHF